MEQTLVTTLIATFGFFCLYLYKLPRVRFFSFIEAVMFYLLCLCLAVATTEGLFALLGHIS